MRVRLLAAAALAVSITACDDGGGGTDPGDGSGDNGVGDAANGVDAARDAAADCELGQVLRDGRCFDRCGVNGPVCGDDELCVRFEGEIACRARCGVQGGGCGVEELCLVLDDEGDGSREGFCAPGACPEGSHKGSDGWCVCDTGDLPPPELPCVVELCGPGNHQGRCDDANRICVDGTCR